jgi:hypothetical protein
VSTTTRRAPGSRASTDRASAFERDARRALGALADALRAAAASVAPRGTNALAMSRVLGIDKSLSWRISRFTAERDPVDGSQHLPGPSGLRIYAAAVRDAGAPMGVARALEAAIDRVERVTGAHAGSRAAFRAMLAHCRDAVGDDERTLEFRRSAFVANSALWGIEARARLLVAVVIPAADGRLGMVLASGFFGLRRMRPGLAWPLARRRVRDPRGGVHDSGARPLDGSVGPHDAPILREFTSIGQRELHPAEGPDGTDWELAPGEVGLAGAVDCVFAERFDAIGDRARGATELMMRLDVPCEVAVIEAFVDRSIAPAAEPVPALHGLLTGGTGAIGPQRERARLPLSERPLRLDPDLAANPLAEVPRHWELVNDCMRAVDRPPDAFVGHRLVVRHPMIPSALTLSVSTET